MAKRKKKKVGDPTTVGAMQMSGPSRRRIDTGVEEVENGFLVRVSSEGFGKKDEPHYDSKTFIAPTHEQAVRISTQSLSRMGSRTKGKKKNGGKKRISAKR